MVLTAIGGTLSVAQRSILERTAANGGPTAYWDARTHDDGPLLKDLASNRHHLQMGSTHVAAITKAPHARVGLLLPGQNGRYAGAASAAPNLNGYETLTFTVLFSDLSSTGATQQFINRQQQIALGVASDWRVELVLTVDGATFPNVICPVVIDPKSVRGIRATRTASSGVVKFEQTFDGTNWTLMSTEVGVSGQPHATPSTNKLDVGATNQGTAYPLKGFVYRATVEGDGTPVFDADFTKQAEGATSFTEDALGATVTINGTTGSDTNDPLFLPLAEDEDPYLYLPGIAGNYASAPDSASMPSDDFDVRVEYCPDFWASGAGQRVVNKYTGSSGFAFDLSGSGLLILYIGDGASIPGQTSSAAVPFVNGQKGWIRATFRQSDKRIQFFTSLDGNTWTQLGVDRTSATAFAKGSSIPLAVSWHGGTSQPTGKIYRAQLYSGINGTLVADFNPSRSRQPHRTVVDSVGNVWTINRSTSGRKAALVDQPMFLFGTDDYMEAPDHDDLDFGAGQDFTVVAAFRHQANVANFSRVITKRDSVNGPGWMFVAHNTLPQGFYGELAGASSVNNNVENPIKALPGNLIVGGIQRFGSSFANLGPSGKQSTVSVATIGDTSNSHPMRIGRDSTGTSYIDMEFIGAAIFRRALSDAEIEEVSREFGWTPKASLLDEAVVAAVPAVIDDGVGMIDLTGRGHNFKLGSTTGADTNDPTMLPYDGEKYAYLPGVAGNYISTPDNNALDITGDIDIRVQMAAQWAALTASSYPISKYHVDAASRSWAFGLLNTGTLALDLHDGTTQAQVNSAATIPGTAGYANGAKIWIRVTWRQSDKRVQFFTSPDGVTWTQLGTDKTLNIAAINASTGLLAIGALGTGSGPVEGKVYKAEVRNGIDGTVVASFNAANAAEPYATVAGGAGETWTFNRPASGKKLAVVDQNLLLLGTDDYAETPDDDELDFGASDSFTVLVLARAHSQPSVPQAFVSKKNSPGAAAGWQMTHRSDGLGFDLHIADDTTGSTGLVLPGTYGYKRIIAGVRNVVADNVTVFRDEVSGASVTDNTTSLVNADKMFLGKDTQGRWLDGEIMGVAIIRRALTAAELTTLANELIAANADRTKRVLTRLPALRSRPPKFVEVS